jgi:ribokinase
VKDISRKLAGPRVLVLGALNIDRTLHVQRLPLPGETLLSKQLVISCGGKGRNQAVAVAALGGHPRLIGAVGDDAEGITLRQDLKDRGVDDSLVATAFGSATGLGMIVVDDDGENSIVVHPGANATVEKIEDLASSGDEPSALLVSLEIPLDTVASAVRTARSQGLLSIVNAAPVPAERDAHFHSIVDNADVLIVNRTEAIELVGGNPDDHETLVESVTGWHRDTGVTVVMTMGAEGAVRVNRDGGRSFRAPAVRTVNTVGAGDVFAAMLCVALASDQTLDDGIALACSAGAVAVSSPASLSLESVLLIADDTCESTIQVGTDS